MWDDFIFILGVVSAIVLPGIASQPTLGVLYMFLGFFGFLGFYSDLKSSG